MSGLFGAVDVNLNIALTPVLEKAKTFSLKSLLCFYLQVRKIVEETAPTQAGHVNYEAS